MNLEGFELFVEPCQCLWANLAVCTFWESDCLCLFLNSAWSLGGCMRSKGKIYKTTKMSKYQENSVDYCIWRLWRKDRLFWNRSSFCPLMVARSAQRAMFILFSASKTHLNVLSTCEHSWAASKNRESRDPTVTPEPAAIAHRSIAPTFLIPAFAWPLLDPRTMLYSQIPNKSSSPCGNFDMSSLQDDPARMQFGRATTTYQYVFTIDISVFSSFQSP